MVKIAIIGRPNVGKSTLFNRLLRQHKAVTHNSPGVTRDNLTGRFAIEETYFSVFDTPGFISKSSFEVTQLTKALQEAKLIIFLLEPELKADDFHLADWLRKTPTNNTKILLVVNKCDKKGGSFEIFYELGLGQPLSVSAEHNIGIRTLLNEIYQSFEESEHKETLPNSLLKFAVVGRPNVGKSTFINNILAQERVLTSDEAGTTRDAVDVDFCFKGNYYTLVDTPGVRKRAKITEDLEIKSVQSSLQAITRADVIIFMFDGRYGLEKQDYTLINRAIDAGKSTLLLANKWDLVEDKESVLKNTLYQCEKALPFGIPICTFSALNDKKYEWIIDQCLALHESAGVKLKTSALNVWLEQAVKHHSPGLDKTSKRAIKLKYIVQVSTHPLKFFISANIPETISRTYITYLINDLRKTFSLKGVPISLIFRRSHNPHVAN